MLWCPFHTRGKPRPACSGCGCVINPSLGEHTMHTTTDIVAMITVHVVIKLLIETMLDDRPQFDVDGDILF